MTPDASHGTLESLTSASRTTCGAFRELLAVRAVEQAAASRPHQPLYGFTLAIKDNIDVAGSCSLAGTAALNGPAERDSAVAELLDAAGAVFVGKAVMTGLAFTALGTHPAGTPVNQLDPERVPGGSSSGSAVAVAAGLVRAAIGSDTGGSIRIPAAFNGLVGHKPTTGLVDLRGVVPLSPTLDTVGPITRTVADARAIMQVLAAAEAGPLPGHAVIPAQLVAELDDKVEAGFRQAVAVLRSMGLHVTQSAWPAIDELRKGRKWGSFAGHELFRDAGDYVSSAPADFIPEAAQDILAYGTRDRDDYARLRQHREQLLAGLTVPELIVCPTVQCVPPLLKDAAYALEGRVLANTNVFNYLGLPAVTVPVAPGSMVGITFAGPAGSDLQLLDVAEAFEAARTSGSASGTIGTTQEEDFNGP